MNKTDNLCINCWEELTQGSVCAACGYDNDSPASPDTLIPRTVLNDRYVVGTVISTESDAITYNGYDLQNDVCVVLREFMPKGLSNRLEGNNNVHVRERNRQSFEQHKQSFLRLWDTLYSLRSLSAVIPVNEVFEENSTVYAVMEYTESVSMREFLLKSPEGNIPWDKARLMFMPVLTTLENLHDKGIIHGSITPDNLVLCRDGKVRLKGFCITECNNIATDLEFNLNDGYTAIEQYDNNHKICPATDMYAFAACIYRALVGSNPPDAPSREINDKLMIPNRIAETIPTYVIKALGSGLQIYPEKRCQSASRMRELLNASPNVVAAAAPAPATHIDEPVREPAVQPVQQVRQQPANNVRPNIDDDKKGSKGKVVAIILVVLIIAAVAAGVYVVKFSGLVGSDKVTTTAVAKQSYTVPDFVSAGYTQSDVENNGAWNKQFTIKFTSEYSTSVAEGIVFKQSVTKGESVQEGTEITLTVSKGVQTASVPDVGGVDVKQATKQLEDLGFKVSTVEIHNDGTYTANTVKQDYGMAPAADSVIAVGTTIVLQVYGEVMTTTEPTTQETTTAAPIVEAE